MLSSSTTPEDLAHSLGTSYAKLNYVIYGKGTSNLYKSFLLPKISGGQREIMAPLPQLKYLQHQLKPLLDKLYEPHPAASAFIEGRGIVYNAKKHIKKAVVFNIDLENFFNSINFGRIRGLLMAPPYSIQADTARIIAHICCVNKTLPQGAPTSPVLSNMIARRLDKQLSHLAKKYNAQYSRYADDITFSFRIFEENEIFIDKENVAPHPSLIKLIESNGFKINSNKTRLQTRYERCFSR